MNNLDAKCQKTIGLFLEFSFDVGRIDFFDIDIFFLKYFSQTAQSLLQCLKCKVIENRVYVR